MSFDHVVASSPEASSIHVACGPQADLVQTSVSQAKFICPFLKLPSELRNRIYQFALTATHGLCFDLREQDQRPLFFALGGTRETRLEDGFNQLKYSCRQLYNETAGLEIKFNNIYVAGSAHFSAGPAKLLSGFLATCSVTKAAWLTSVTLHNFCYDYDPDMLVESVALLLPIADFCRSQPNVNVRYISAYFDMAFTSPGLFLSIGAYLNIKFREKDLTPALAEILASTDNEMDFSIFDSAWYEEAAKVNVPNLRFWPDTDNDLDEEKFRKAVKFYLTPGVEDVCVALAKEWYSKGI